MKKKLMARSFILKKHVCQGKKHVISRLSEKLDIGGSKTKRQRSNKKNQEMCFARFSEMTNTKEIYCVRLRVLCFYPGYICEHESLPCNAFLAIDEQVWLNNKQLSEFVLAFRRKVLQLFRTERLLMRTSFPFRGLKGKLISLLQMMTNGEILQTKGKHTKLLAFKLMKEDHSIAYQMLRFGCSSHTKQI